MKTNPRRRRNRGILLIEMLAAIAIISVVVAISAPLVGEMLQGSARTMRTVQSDRTLSHMLDRLRDDVQGAERIDGGMIDGKPMLCINDGILKWEVRDGRVSRKVQGTKDGEEVQYWDVPAAVIEWKEWPEDAAHASALEVRTGILEDAPGGPQQKLSRTHLFFLKGREGGPAK